MSDLISYDEQFKKIVYIIESAKEHAYRKVNEELILMYRDIGEYISKQSEKAEYGDAFVQKIADFFAANYPDLKGFNRRGFYRMKQFYELYKDNEKGGVSVCYTSLILCSVHTSYLFLGVLQIPDSFRQYRAMDFIGVRLEK